MHGALSGAGEQLHGLRGLVRDTEKGRKLASFGVEPVAGDLESLSGSQRGQTLLTLTGTGFPVSLGNAGGDAVITAGTLNLLAGGTSNATTLRVTLGGTATQSVGVKAGTVAVDYASDGTGTTGLAATATNGADTLAISGTVYIIGGAEIYQAFLPHTDEVLVTHPHGPEHASSRGALESIGHITTARLHIGHAIHLRTR